MNECTYSLSTPDALLSQQAGCTHLHPLRLARVGSDGVGGGVYSTHSVQSPLKHLEQFSVSLPFPAKQPRRLNHSGHVHGPRSGPVCIVFRAVLAEGSWPVHLCRVLLCGERCPSALSSGDAFCRHSLRGSGALSAVHR